MNQVTNYLNPGAVWAQKITESYSLSVEALINTGRLLCEAKADPDLEHGEWLRLVTTQLPFKERTAQRLMSIGRCKHFANPSLLTHLPADSGSLYLLSRIDEQRFAEMVSNGTVSAEMKPKTLTTARKKEVRDNRERVLGEMQRSLPSGRYGVILADPAWRFKSWSENGMDRAADNHYPTKEIEEIKALGVGEIAHRDCVLFLWVTVPMAAAGHEVMSAWGFNYRTQFIWKKNKISTGYWNRNLHEMLYVGVRGDNVPAPAMGTQFESVLAGDVRGHSEKPDWQYDLIERFFPNLPKIELYARKARAGWESWGNELPMAAE